MDKNQYKRQFLDYSDVWECELCEDNGKCKIIGRCIFPFPYNPKLCGYRTKDGQKNFYEAITKGAIAHNGRASGSTVQVEKE